MSDTTPPALVLLTARDIYHAAFDEDANGLRRRSLRKRWTDHLHDAAADDIDRAVVTGAIALYVDRYAHDVWQIKLQDRHLAAIARAYTIALMGERSLYLPSCPIDALADIEIAKVPRW